MPDTMRNLNVAITEAEFERFGLQRDQISFSDLIDLMSKELTRQNLEKSIALAEKYGLSNMTMDEITNEVKAVRQNAKNRN